jgi:hypothetical protein
VGDVGADQGDEKREKILCWHRSHLFHFVHSSKHDFLGRVTSV